LKELFGLHVSVNHPLVFDPLAPRLEPKLVVPVTVGIASSLKMFNVFDIFLRTGLAKSVWHPKTGRVDKTGGLIDVRAAFDTLGRAVRTVKHFLHDSDLALPLNGFYRIIGAPPLFFQRDDIRHRFA
jgi:hypothetical protein